MKNNEDRKNREEKGKKLDISISNQDLYHSFIPGLVIPFTSFVIRLKALILCHIIKRIHFWKKLVAFTGKSLWSEINNVQNQYQEVFIECLEVL